MYCLEKVSGIGGDGREGGICFSTVESNLATLGNALPTPTAKTSMLPVYIRDNIVTGLKLEETTPSVKEGFQGI